MAFAAAFLFAITIRPGWPQDLSKKKDLAVFNLYYSSFSIPYEVLGGIDEEIKNVFVNLGRFNVIGMTHRLGESDVNAFIEKIKQFKNEKVEIPEKVQMGQEYFTQADMDRLVGSFIVAVPTVASYDWYVSRKGESVVTIKTAFTFINVETQKTFAHTIVETSGSGQAYPEAVRSAVNAIAPSLVYEVRKIPEFQLKTGLMEVKGSEVILEFGKDMGIRTGDEYLVMDARVLSSGKQVTEEKGLLLVRKVDEEVSFATVLYADRPLEMGDQLQELPRLGAESKFFTRAVLLGDNSSFDMATPIFVGVRLAPTRGFYAWRPFIEIEVPLHVFSESVGFPLNVSLGAEYDFYMGRLLLSPWLALGIGMDIPDSEDEAYRLSHFGGHAGLDVSYLFTRDIKFCLEAGYMSWMKVGSDAYIPSYGGLFAGAGLSIKF